MTCEPKNQDAAKSARAIFAHHDKIAAVKSGTVLMLAEPIKVQRMTGDQSGTMAQMQAGEWLRSLFCAGGLWCEAAIDGRITTVVVVRDDFCSLEIHAEPGK